MPTFPKTRLNSKNKVFLSVQTYRVIGRNSEGYYAEC